ncbi:MAG: HlyD family secretion protein, partial [Deltaproteobacteria bacterium]
MSKLSPSRILVLIGAAAGLGVLVYLFLPQPPEVDLAAVARGPMEVTVDENGKTRIRERYVVSAPLAGRMSRIDLHPGDPVAAGKTLLAAIDPADPALLNDRDRAEADARVKAAEAAGQRARAAVEQSKEELELAEHQFQRARNLIGSNAVSRQDYDAAEHKQGAARQQLSAAEFGVQIANFELELARAALLRTRPRSADDADSWRFELRSPVKGTVLHVFQEDATVVTPGQRLIEVGDPSELEVEVEVLSTDAVKIAPGAKVRVEHWGGQPPLVARVRRIEPAGFTKISALGVEEQRVIVLAIFVDPPEKRSRLGDAFRVEARIVIW